MHPNGGDRRVFLLSTVQPPERIPLNGKGPHFEISQEIEPLSFCAKLVGGFNPSEKY